MKYSNTWTPWRIKHFSRATCPASILPASTSLQRGYEKEALKLILENQCCPYREPGSPTSLSDGQTSTTQQTLSSQVLQTCKRGLGDCLATLWFWKISYIRLRMVPEGAHKLFQTIWNSLLTLISLSLLKRLVVLWLFSWHLACLHEFSYHNDLVT